MSDIQPLTMSTRQAAAFLGVGRNKLLRLLQTKRIKAKDLDGRLRFTTKSLREFLDALPDALEAERQAPSLRISHTKQAHRGSESTKVVVLQQLHAIQLSDHHLEATVASNS